MPVIFDLLDQMTLGPRSYQLLQIFSLLQSFCLVLSFKGYFTKFFITQTQNNLRPDINCRLYVYIMTGNNTSGDIDEFVCRIFKRIANVKEIDVVAKVATVFFLSASLDIMMLFRPCTRGNSSQIQEFFCVICYYMGR